MPIAAGLCSSRCLQKATLWESGIDGDDIWTASLILLIAALQMPSGLGWRDVRAVPRASGLQKRILHAAAGVSLSRRLVRHLLRHTCKLGWTGEFCNECVPYPGCKRGTCRDPWECKCEPGWGGFLCSDRLDFCLKNPMLCLNGGNCTSLPAEDGHYSCSCLPGFSGSRCQDSAPGLKASSSTSMPLVVVTAIPIPVKESTDASLTRRSNATVSSSRLPITNAETRPTPDDKENELLRRRA
ncbi:unnamed protein product [Notodromas monacha]|uniref:EGF-like domain-containing protein n=1 Tax=Notodromas monacha TaxID=399045 RepID=A0A7R9BDY2_9CRUS|nr:unnamed protein product [Notodromas monacha]CAG0913616.1 unnamed protein product [Notodromas monacha]